MRGLLLAFLAVDAAGPSDRRSMFRASTKTTAKTTVTTV